MRRNALADIVTVAGAAITIVGTSVMVIGSTLRHNDVSLDDALYYYDKYQEVKHGKRKKR